MSEQIVRQPRQARSRRSMEAIYAAALELLAEGGWDAVTVGEIERRSGVSRGTFYLRFPTRDALVDYVHERLIVEVRRHQERIFGPLMTGNSISIEHAASLAVRGLADVFSMSGKAMVQGARMGSAPTGPEALADLSRDVIVVLRRGVGDDADEGVLEFVVELCFGAFVARQRPASTFGDHAPITDEQFVGRVADVVSAYLGTAGAHHPA